MADSPSRLSSVFEATGFMLFQKFLTGFCPRRISQRRRSPSRRSCKSYSHVWRASVHSRTEQLEPRLLLTASPNGDDLRTLRLAVSATEEYTAFFGTRTAAQQAIVTTVANMNEIFRRELNLQLDLIMNTSIIFGSGNSSDPFSSSVSSAIGQNQTLLDSVIGAANYDIGHVFGTFGGGGFATLESAGMNGIKGEGASGTSTPFGLGFELLSIHEFAHQLGATHSFNGVEGNCVQRNATTAWEPGSGSTIMGYAGICPAFFATPPSGDNLQNDADGYFHAGSIDQMVSHLETLDGMGVGTISSNVNQIPTVSAGNDFTIPAGTAFSLTATGMDADGDTLLYNYEQMDLGPAQTVNPNASAAARADNGSSPLFRSFEPAAADESGSFTRVFPQLSDILGGTSTKGEQLPTTNRSLNFRATARDQQGGVNGDDVTLTVVDTGSAFVITTLNSSTTVTGGSSQSFTWDVAGTTGNGIGVSSVDIRLSMDGGLTFPHLLATTANDGSTFLTLPNIDTTTARFQVNAVGNVFFDINDADITIASNASVAGARLVESGGGTAIGEVPEIGAATDTYTIALNTTPSGPVNITISGGSDLLVSVNGSDFDSSQVLSLSNTSPRTITVRGLNDGDVEGTHTGVIAHVVSSSSDPAYPTSLLINSLDVTIADDEQPPLIGVDLQQSGETVPANWTEINENDSIFSAKTFSNLIREDGLTTTVDLTIGPPSSQPITFGGSEPATETIPMHTPNLVDAGGLFGWTRGSNNVVNARWGGLTAGAVYNIYVLAAERFNGAEPDINHTVTITGAGGDNPAPFTQTTSGFGGELRVNGQQGDSSQTLESFALPVTANGSGEINVQFARNDGVNSNVIYLSALAIQQAITPSSAVSFSSGTLTVNLAGGQDVQVTSSGGPGGVVQVSIDGTPASFGTVTPASVQSIVVNGGSGDNDIDLGSVTSTSFTNGGGVIVTVDALGGNDSLTGSAFADTLDGGDGADTILGGLGNDHVFAGAGNDLVDGGVGNNQLFGDAGSDTISGLFGRDLIRGGDDGDLLNGGNGFDTLAGDRGDDTINGGNGNDTVFAGAGRDFVSGDSGNDRLFGENGYDTIFGGLGNDFLRGGFGEDRLFGGDGHDELIGDSQNDRLFGGVGNDTQSGGDGNDFVRGGSGSDNLSGNDGEDELFGDQDSDTLNGGNANDTLTASDGADVVFAGAGDDLVDGGTGDDLLFGDSGNDTISGSNRRDLIRGGTDNDLLDGGIGFDTLFGDQGDDTISGGNGNDTVFGGNGRDSVRGDSGNDRLFGNNGYDTVSGGIGNDFVRGGRGNDLLSGDGGLDELIGDEHNDTLNGGDDADTITGGNGSDRVDGGEGADTIDVQEAPAPDGIDSVVGGDMADTIFTDPVDLLI
jgi:hypothetical protein